MPMKQFLEPLISALYARMTTKGAGMKRMNYTGTKSRIIPNPDTSTETDQAI